MTVFIKIFSTCCVGDSKYCSEKVSEVINKRLGTGWNDALPPPFKQTTIFFLSGEPVGPDENTDHCKDLSVNWCLGDSSIEILDSITGYAINKSVILNKLMTVFSYGHTVICASYLKSSFVTKPLRDSFLMLNLV